MYRRLARQLTPMILLGVAALAPSVASAQEVAVAPFLPKAGLDQKVANNVTSLVASELDFMSDFDGANQLEAKPKSLTLSCLNKASCLKAIGRTAGADFVVAGSIAPAGDEYEVYMVLLDVGKGTYVRKVTAKVDGSPSGMADSMGAHVSELVTGQGPGKQEDSVVEVDDFDMFDEDDLDEFDFGGDDGPDENRLGTPGNSERSLDDFEDEPDDWELEQQREDEARREREAAAARKREEEDRLERERQAEAQRRKDEERRRREELARKEADERAAADRARREREAREEEERVAAERARQREADDRARREAEAAREDDFDDISFGSVDPDDIEVEIDDINFGDASSEIVVLDDDPIDYDDLDDIDFDSLDDPDPRDSRDSRDSRNSSRDDRDDRDSRDRDRDSQDRLADLDGPSSEVNIRGARGENDPRFGITLRGGYSKFQTFDFVTYGAELSIPVGEVFFLGIGLEGYSTQRDVPPKLQEEQGRPPEEWNTIAPFNFGVKYQPTNRPFRPYIGGDVTVTPYTFEKFRMAPGLRARGGFDYMFTDAFGVNLNLAAGFWYGSEFEIVQKDLQPLGGVPSVSLGTTILF